MLHTKVITTLVATALALSLASCGGDDKKADSGTSKDFPAGSTMARLNAAGAMKVGTKFDQPGFGLKGLEATPAGFDVEIAKIIADELGISASGISYTESPSSLRETLLIDGTVDVVVATYTINDARKERIGFAGPYYEAGQDLMVAKNDTKVTGPESLKPNGSRVCSVTGSTPAETILKYVDKSKLTLFDVYSKCADALKNGQVDVVTTDNVILLGFVAKAPDAFKIVEKPFTKEPYGIGYKKGDTAFCEFINATLTKASADGRYAAAWTKTAGKFAPVVPTLPTLAPCA